MLINAVPTLYEHGFIIESYENTHSGQGHRVLALANEYVRFVLKSFREMFPLSLATAITIAAVCASSIGNYIATMLFIDRVSQILRKEESILLRMIKISAYISMLSVLMD